MATLVLTAALAGTGANLGFATTMLLTLGAAAVDSAVIYPSLFPPEEVKGQRLSNYEFQHAEEGAPANRLFGKEVRVAGTLIWAGALREIEDRERGGKGGRGGEFVKYKYYRHVAVEIARCKRGKTIKNIKKVLADGRPFYDPLGLSSSASNKISALVFANVTTFGGFGGENGNHTLARFWLRLSSDEDAGGPDLSSFQSGQMVTVSGFTGTHALSTSGDVKIETTGDPANCNNVGNNLIFVKVSDTGTLSKGDTLTIAGVAGSYTITAVDRSTVWSSSEEEYYYAFPSEAFTGTVGTPQTAIVRLNTTLPTAPADEAVVTVASGAAANNGTWLCTASGRTAEGTSYVDVEADPSSSVPFVSKDNNLDTVSITQEDRTYSELIAKDIRFYLGSRTQEPDVTIVDVEAANVGGAANVPAFRGRAYMVVEDLELTDFGNRIPNFEFVAEVEDDDSLALMASEMLQDAGISPSDFDLSALPTTLKCGGFVVRGVQNLKAAFQPPMLSYHLISQQTDKLKLLRRTDATLIDITGKTVAFAPGDRPSRPAKFTQLGDSKIPTKVEVRYFDPENDYQIGTKRSQNPNRLTSVEVFDTNMAMSGTEAQRLANTLYEFTRTSGRQGVSFTLPPSYISQIRESIRVRLNVLGQDAQYLIMRADLGANFILQCEAVQDDLEAFTQTAVGEGTLA